MAFIPDMKREVQKMNGEAQKEALSEANVDAYGKGTCINCDCQTQSAIVRNGCGCTSEPIKVYPMCSGCFKKDFENLGCQERGKRIKALRTGKVAKRTSYQGNAPPQQKA